MFIWKKVLLGASNRQNNKQQHTQPLCIQCMQYNYRKKWDKIEPRTSKSLGSLIRECTFWKNCNQLLWLLLCTTTKSAGDTFGFLWQPEVKKAKGKKTHLFCEEFSTLSPLKSNWGWFVSCRTFGQNHLLEGHVLRLTSIILETHHLYFLHSEPKWKSSFWK